MPSAYSVVIPVFNEADILGGKVDELVSFLNGRAGGFEIVLGDNGSTDGTLAAGRALEKKFPGVVHIFSTPEKGVGNGLRIAALNAGNDFLVEMPIDLSVSLDFIPRAVELLEKNDVVIGSKQSGGQSRAAWLKALSSSYIFLARLLLGLPYTDYSVGAKAYRKSAIASRLSAIDSGSFYVTDLIYFAKKKGLRIVEIPVSCEDWRKGKFSAVHEVVYRVKMLFGLWIREGILGRIGSWKK